MFNKNILVTGSEGFIGSHLTEFLLKKGFNVTALVLYNSFGSWGWLDSLPKNLKSEINVVLGDISDSELINSISKKQHTIFHLAALIGIPYSYNAPKSYIQTNINGTQNILHSALKNNCENVIITSTSEVYGTAEYIPINEKHILKGQSPYSATKIAADKIAESYFHSFGLPVKIARPFNTYGPRQSARAIIPNIITQLISGKSYLKVGNIDTYRDFNYVTDVVRGLYYISKCEKFNGSATNICTGKKISIKQLIDLTIKKINPKKKISIKIEKSRKRTKDSEVFVLQGCNKKIKKYTKWENQISFDKGLDLVIDWFRDKKNFDKYKSDIYNI